MSPSLKQSSRFLGVLLGPALLFTAPVAAQAPPAPGQDKTTPISKVERKNLAPVSKDILLVKLPKPSETTLDNGLTVMVLEDHRFPTVSVTLRIDGAGALYEPASLSGLASGTALLLREGTKTRDSRTLAEDVDKLGATLTANANFGGATANINASGLSDNFDEWFPLFVDILQNPSFPADEFTKLSGRQKAQLKQVRSNAGFLVAERFSRAVYGSHPAATIFPTEASIDAMNPELLAKWHHERYVPQNAILGVSGDVDTRTLLVKLRKWLGGWAKTDLKPEMPPNPTPPTAMKIFLVNRPSSVQTDVAIGNIAISRRDPDYPAVVVMNRIVGGGPAARLFMNLREEKGYTYGVYSNFSAQQYPGPWQAGGNMRSEVTEGAMTEFFKEFRRIREEAVPASEMDDAARSVVAAFALSLESPAQLLDYAITRKIYNFPADYWDTYPAKIAAVTAADVARVANKYINPANMQVVAVGEASKIKAVLDKFGPVEVYDTEGKPVTAPASPGH